MTKRTIITTVTPLPPQIPRGLVIEYLHHHASMIELNPLVIKHEFCRPPKNALADEFHCLWYELTDRIQYFPGLGTLTSGQVKYLACFHDLPYGLQTHIYAPMGLDIKNKWTVRGNLPGEPREARELGVDVPIDVLYLREDVDMRCNRVMTGFVKKNLKSAHRVLVDRLVAKARLAEDIQYSLDRGINHPRASLLSSEGSFHGSQHGPQPAGSRFSQQTTNLAPPPGQGPGSPRGPGSPSFASSTTAVSSPGMMNPNSQFAYEYQKSISDASSEPDKNNHHTQNQTSPGLYPPPLYHRISAGNAGVPDEYRWQLQMQQMQQQQQQMHSPPMPPVDSKQHLPAELPANHAQRRAQTDRITSIPRMQGLNQVGKLPPVESSGQSERHEMPS